VRKQTILLSFEPQGTPPSGDPPSFEVKSGPGQVRLLEGDETGLPTEASYETHVAMTSESTFVEDGLLSFDDGGLRLSTIGAGALEPSAEEGTLQGAVLWRVEGTGRFEGATGCLSSSFAVAMESGMGTEKQILRLFLP
jgi:hypothetical protein